MRKGKKLRMSEDEMFWYRLFRDNHCLESRETGKVGAEMDGTSKSAGKAEKVTEKHTKSPGKGGDGVKTAVDGKERSGCPGFRAMVGYGMLIALPVIWLISGIVLAAKRLWKERSDLALAFLVLRLFYMVFSFTAVCAMVELIYAMSTWLRG